MPAQREWFDKDYYKTLGVAKNATDKEITKAYRALAKKYHPDANPGSEDRFKDISAAYDVLGDTKQRNEYDEVRRLGPMSQGFGSGPQYGPGQTIRMEDMGGIGDILGGLFGGGGGRQRGTQRGQDLETDLQLSFEEAIRGVTTSVQVPDEVRCTSCNGSGAAPGAKTHTCSRCGGKGSLNDNQGLFSLNTVCPVCNGRGQTVDSPCPTCRGQGVVLKQKGVKVRIPPGVDDGQRIRVKGRGEKGMGFGSAGDLYVRVVVKKHPTFQRKGSNLLVNIPVSFSKAALGTTVTVPTLDDSVTMKIPPGTQPGTQLRVKGKGVPASNGKKADGDLLVKIEVQVPRQLNEEQKKLIEDLDDLLQVETGKGSEQV